jgi:hypothetical protein
MANLISPFTVDPLQSATGFQSPGFVVDSSGNTSISGNILLSSGYIGTSQSVLLTTSSLGSAITSSSLTSVGTLTSLTVSGAITTNALVATSYITGTLSAGTQPNVTGLGTLNNLQVGGVDANGYSAELISYVLGNNNSSSIAFKSSRGTSSNPLAVQSGDILGLEDFYGYFNGAFVKAASIQWQLTGTPVANTSFPVQLNFNMTSGSGSYNSPQAVATLTNAGVFTTTTINATSAVQVNGLNLKSLAIALSAALS